MKADSIGLLSTSSVESLKMIEGNLANIPAVRSNLESIVIQQFKALSSGLSAFLFLNKNDNNIVFQLFKFENKYIAINEEAKFRDFHTEFLKKIVTGEVKPINPEDLVNIEISIFQRRVPLWDYQSINEQLESVGSNLRAIVPGNLIFLEHALLNLLGEVSYSGGNAGYILGEVEPATCNVFGRAFDFKIEYAISPFLDTEAPAFSFDDTMVIRQEILRKITSSNDITLTKMHAYIHECYHLTGAENNRKKHNFYTLHYNNEIRKDILRFTQSPRNIDEISRTFDASIIQLMIKRIRDLGIEITKDPFTIQDILNSMVEEKKLFFDPNGLIFSKQYTESRLWLKNW